MYVPLKCWAKEVSECGEESSATQHVTRGMLPDVYITVQAAPPPSDGARDSRDANSDDPHANALCAKHAAELAAVDAALVDLVNCIREIERLRAVRSKVAKNWPVRRFVADGVGVERCILKMVMNHGAVQGCALDGWRPPDWLPKVIFGAEELKSGCGLAVVVRLGDTVVDRERIGFTFTQSELTGLRESVVLELRQGLRLVCTWEKPVQSLGELRLHGARYDAGSDALWHPRRVSFSNGELDLGLSLDFDWSGKWAGGKHPSVVALRGKFAAAPQ